jgi:hypothetical protein
VPPPVITAIRPARSFILPPSVILSEAKDLMPVASGDEVLRFAQDDLNCYPP